MSNCYFSFPAEQTQRERCRGLTVQYRRVCGRGICEVSSWSVATKVWRRGMLENLLFFTHNPTLAFNNHNNRPSCHCGFKQANSFLKYTFLLSVLIDSLGCVSLAGLQWTDMKVSGEAHQLRQEEEEVGGRKVRRWWRDRLQEEGREDYSSISLLLSEIKDGLRINWISPLSRFPQRSNADFRNVRDEPTVNRVQSQHGWMLPASFCSRDLN